MAPQVAAGPRVEGERSRIGCTEEPPARERETVRAVIGRMDDVLPPQLPRLEIERVHRRAQVLEVDRRADHERRGGERAEGRAAGEPELPANVERTHSSRVDRGASGARAAEITVWLCPVCARGNGEAECARGGCREGGEPSHKIQRP